MKAFTIDTDNNVIVYASRKAATEANTGIVFTGEDNLAELLGADSKRLVTIWNTLTGVLPVKKFTSMAVANKRILAELQKLSVAEAPVPATPFDDEPTAAATAQPKAPRKAKAEKPAKAARAPKVANETASLPREGSKLALVLEMLKRKNGATLEEIMAAMDWQIHTTRALMSAGGAYAKKYGITVISENVGEKRTYRVAR